MAGTTVRLEVSLALLEQLREWSEPMRVRAVENENGEWRLEFKREEE